MPDTSIDPKVSLNEARPLLQTKFVELSTEITLKVRIIVDNIADGSTIPNPTLTTLIYFDDNDGERKEYGIMAEGDMSDLHHIEDVSQALCIPLDAKTWNMRIIEED